MSQKGEKKPAGQAGRFGMRAAYALRISSGRIIFIFGIAERLRTLRYPIFTGRDSGRKKAPGSGRSSGRGGVQFYGVVLVSSKPMAT